MWEVMGCREAAIETAPGGRTTIRWNSADIPGLAAGEVLPARWYKETLEPLSPAARVVAQFEDGSAAAVMARYGEGGTLMLGSYVSAAAQSTPTPAAERFFAGLLEWAGVALPVRVEGSPIEARHLESGQAALLFLFNHGKEHARSDVWLARSAGEYIATDIVTRDAVALRRAGDGVALTLQLAPAGVRVLTIARR